MFIKGNFKSLGKVEVGDLRDKVLTISDDVWLGNSARQSRFEVHKYTQTLALILDEDFRHENPTYHPLYTEFKELIQPIADKISSFYDQTLKAKRLKKKNVSGYFIRAIIVRLLPGGVITPHTDNGHSLSRCHRVHVPLVTSDQTSFMVGDELKHMEVGDIWEINNRNVHAVKNESDISRIHLIMDYVLPGERVNDAIDGDLIC